MDNNKNTTKAGKLRPVRPIAGKAFKVKFLPKNVHVPTQPIYRPPWDNTLFRCSSKRYEKSITRKVEDIAVPCPDYTCFKAFRYRLDGDTAVRDGDVVVMKKNYKPAPWCDTVQRFRQVKHCTELECGKTKEYDIQMPSNYQTVYIDEKAERKTLALGDVKCGEPLYVHMSPATEKNEPPENCKRVFYENMKAFKQQTSNCDGQPYRKIERYICLPY